MIPILFAIAVLVFTMMYVTPGDPVRIKLGDTITEKAYNIERERLGLDKPYLIQLGTFLLKLVRGDLGESFRNGQSVSKEVASRLPYTLKLSLLSMVVAIMIGVTTGIISAIKQYSILDNVVTALSLFGVSAPAFWIALMMVLLFAVHLGWLPPSGTYGPQYWIMPVATLGLNQGATIMRFTRTSMLDVIRQDYIQTARAKGQKESVIILNHALRNALMPIVTVLGVQLGALMTGSILVETVFSIPGIGKFLVDSVNMRDRPSLQATVIVIGFLCSTINLLVDILYCCIDPRVKTTLIQRKEG
jgi:peptide/nickel transport system permease protein